MADRIAHNPSDVLYVAMTADALRVIRNALATEASIASDAADRHPDMPRYAATLRTTARLARGVAADLRDAFNQEPVEPIADGFHVNPAAFDDGWNEALATIRRSRVVGASLTEARAADIAADKATLDVRRTKTGVTLKINRPKG